MQVTPEKAEAILRELPDPAAARNFVDNLEKAHPGAAKKLKKDAGLYSDVSALAAWSPLLATTLLQNPDYITWLARVRKFDVDRTGVELLESLGRFQGTHSQLAPHDLLARFRRRELLRIYLQDIRRTGTVSEITEELSHLADAILTHALRLARQELENRYGSPHVVDESGRVSNADLAIVALGKLGSMELNFASDIDLMFIFSDEGDTSGTGTRGETSNREFFNRLALAVVQMVGDQSGEGAAYRVDLRLRPYGRDGTLASSRSEAIRYYGEKAQPWELQALIRSRCVAGSAELFTEFARGVAPFVYSPVHTWAAVSESNAEAKRKIDRKLEQGNAEFNVKLGRGGIREIEFIAQALGMARGGNDPWLRSPHTLIALGRLEERKLISNQERIDLFLAYEFLRSLEHRLQMEHGLQTHSVPAAGDRRTLVARRMNFAGPRALHEFDHALTRHTAKVKRIFDQLLGLELANDPTDLSSPPKKELPETDTNRLDLNFTYTAIKEELSADSAPFLTEGKSISRGRFEEWIDGEARRSGNPALAATLARIGASLKRSEVRLELSDDDLQVFLRLCSVSEYFADMFCASPALIGAVSFEALHGEPYRDAFALEVDRHDDFRSRIGALRRGWSRQLVRIGALDAMAAIAMREANRRQTLLAETSLDQAWEIACRELVVRYGPPDRPLKFAVLGLGRLGGGGMDYGSDLDVVLIYDDDGPPPYEKLTNPEVYGRAVEHFVAALSSLTRDGYLYRVDLRLRPDGRHGPVCSGARTFLEYLGSRSQPWEWLAYVKLRAVAGSKAWGAQVETEARSIIHGRAAVYGGEALREETRRVRDRLEKEHAQRVGGFDIKYGAGGMLDVYFAVRFLQLRHRIPDLADDRTTTQTLRTLYAAKALAPEDFEALSDGYRLLRDLDHRLRLAIGRVRRVPSAGHPALERIARDLDRGNGDALLAQVADSMSSIRCGYSNIVG